MMNKFSSPRTLPAAVSLFTLLVALCLVLPVAQAQDAKAPQASSVVSQKTFSVEVSVSLDGFKGVELWYTMDNGANWLLSGMFEGRPKSLKFTAPKDGSYGFLQVPVDANNQRSYTPKSGTRPDVVIAVDTTTPQVVLESPNGGNIFKNEGYEMIKWFAADANLPPLPVAISVSTDGGKTWIPVSQNEPNTGKYFWKLPSLSSTKYRVKVQVRDLAGLVGSATSESDFTIDGLSPEGVITGPAKSSLTTMELNYRADDVGGSGLAMVELWYTTDDGASWEKYGEDKDAVSPLKFTAPDGIYGLRLVCVDRVGNASAVPKAGLKPQLNLIVDSQKPQVKLLSFTETDKIFAGNYQYSVIWIAKDANLPDNGITLQFSEDGGSTWQAIPQATDISNSVQPFVWKTPNKYGDKFKIRVVARDLLDNLGIAESPNFRLDPYIPEVEMTDVASKGPAGTMFSYKITNAGSSPVKKVILWITKDGGDSWSKCAEDTKGGNQMLVSLSDGDYGFTFTCITQLGEETGRVAAAPKRGDVAQKVLTIDQTLPKVALRSFNGNESYRGGTRQDIVWEASDIHLAGTVTIDYSDNSGATWKAVAAGVAAGLGKYEWTLPQVTGVNFRVRVVALDKAGNSGKGESSADFVIDSLAPEGVAIAPDNATSKGFEVIYKAKDNGPSGLDLVVLYRSRAVEGRPYDWKEYATIKNHPGVFTVSVDADGSYAFKLVSIDKAGNSSAVPGPQTAPDCVTFVDSTAPTVLLLSMRGAEVFKGGSIQNIKFRSYDNNTKELLFGIFYSDTEGRTWKKIADNLVLPSDVDNTYSYGWAVPDETNSQYRVRVEARDKNNNLRKAESDTNFAIDNASPMAVLQGPATAQQQTVQLVYKSSDSGKAGIRTHSLYFRLRGEKDYRKYREFPGVEPLIGFAAPDGNYELYLVAEDGVGNRSALPDRDTAHQLALTIDTVGPRVKLITFDGGEVVGAAKKSLVRWEIIEENPAEMFVTVEVTYNNGKSWNIIAAQQKNSGMVEWAPPKDFSSPDCRLRVSTTDAVGTRGEAVSEGTFTVDGLSPIVKALQPTMSNKSPTQVKFYAEDKGPAGIDAIEAYTSRDDGRTWMMHSTFIMRDVRDFTLPMNLPEGKFAIFLVAIDRAGNRSEEPKPGNPQLITFVDTVKPKITLKGIEDGGMYKAGDSVQISWEVMDENSAQRPVSLRWSSDFGKSWTTVAENLELNGKMDWRLPDRNGVYAFSLRARDAAGNDEDVFVKFAVDSLPPVVKIFSEMKAVHRGGDAVEIRWSASDENLAPYPLSILFSADGGKKWEFVEKELANTGSYIWQVNRVTSRNCALQLIFKDKAGNATEKMFTFGVDTEVPVARLNGPTFTSNQATELRYEVTSSGSAPIASYSLFYRARGERDYRKYKEFTGPEPAIVFNARDGVYDLYLTCANVVGTQMPPPQSDSQAQLVFTVDTLPPRVTLLSPVGGEFFGKNQPVVVQWNASDDSVNELSMSVEVSVNGGKSWSQIAGDLRNSGAYEWKFPANVNGAECKVKVVASDKAGIRGEDSTKGTFTIDSVEPFVRAIGPDFAKERPAQLLFEGQDNGPAGIKYIDVYVSRDSGATWDLLRSALASEIKGKTIDLVLAEGRYSLYLCATDNAGNRNQPPYNNTKPQHAIIIDTQAPEEDHFTGIMPGDVFASGTIINFSWLFRDQNLPMNPVSVYYSDDAGRGWTKLFENQPGVGKFEWQVPQRNGKYGLSVKVVDAAGNALSKQIDFSVSNDSPRLKATMGIAGVVKGGNVIDLTWNAESEFFSDNPISIMFSQDNGRTWQYVEKDLPNTGIYHWKVPVVTASQCMVKVAARDKVGKKSESQYSNRPFSIDSAPPVVNITDVIVLESEGALIRYQAQDVGDSGVDSVKLYVTENNGQRWVKRDEHKPAGSEFKLKIGSGVYGIYLMATDRVGNQSPPDEPAWGTAPQKVFEVRPGSKRIILEGLLEDGSYDAASTLAFSWLVSGVTDPFRVKLEFLRKDNSEWEKPVSGLKSKDNFSVKLPMVQGTYKIRLTANDNREAGVVAREVSFIVVERPDKDYAAKADLIKIVTLLDDGAVRAGTPVTIKWKGADEFLKANSVLVEYSLDDGKNWTGIASKRATTDELSWNVPSGDAYACRIRVQAKTLGDNTVSDEIPASIRIDKSSPDAEIKFGKPGNKAVKPKAPEQPADPTANAYYLKAFEYSQKGNYAGAVNQMEKALEIEPNSAKYRDVLGTFYFSMKDYKKAITEYDQAVKLQDTFSYRYNFGLAYYYAYSYNQARAQFEKALAFSPSDPACTLMLGMTLKELRDIKTAKDCFEQVIKLAPDSSFANEAKDRLKNIK